MLMQLLEEKSWNKEPTIGSTTEVTVVQLGFRNGGYVLDLPNCIETPLGVTVLSYE